MLVKVGGTVYDSRYQPLMIYLYDEDKQNIADMAQDVHKYCSFPSHIDDVEAIKVFMELDETALRDADITTTVRNADACWCTGKYFLCIKLHASRKYYIATVIELLDSENCEIVDKLQCKYKQDALSWFRESYVRDEPLQELF